MREVIGVTGQFSAVDNLLTGEENLTLMADLNHLARAEGRRRVADLLERLDLVEEQPEAGRRPTRAGMRRRLDLAMTLMGDPRIIFLDEPTTGLDPRSRRTVWRIVRELVDRGVTIFLTTHYLEEADQLADRVALLDHGRLIAEGTPDELKRLIPGGHIRLRVRRRAGARSGSTVPLPGCGRDDDALTLQVPSEGRDPLAPSPARPARCRLDPGRTRRDPHAGSRRRLPGPHGPARRGRGTAPMTHALVRA